MKRLILLFLILSSLPLSARATDRVDVERARREDKVGFDAVLKGMADDFKPQPTAIGSSIEQRVDRARTLQNQGKAANTRDRNSHDVRTRQTPNVSPPTPQRTR